MIIDVSKDNLVLINENLIHTGEYKVNEVIFNFSSEYIETTNKAVFTNYLGSYEVPIIDGRCDIPNEVLKEQEIIKVGVYGYKLENDEYVIRYSPSPIDVKIIKGSYVEGAENGETITPTQFEIYTQSMNEGLNKIDNALLDLENRVNSGEFNGEKGEPGKSGANATINGFEAINIIGGDNIALIQQGSDFYISYNGTEMSVEIVEELPIEGIVNKIYLVLKETGTEEDIYDEYLFINGVWEHIGSTAIDLSNYYTKDEVNELLENIDVDLPVATTDILGGIKVGETLNIGEDGTLNTSPNIIWLNQNNITDYFEKEGSNYYIYMDEAPKRVVFMFDRALNYASAYLKGGKVYARPDREHTSIQASLTFNANAMCFWIDEYTESSTYYNNSINIISPGEPVSRVCYYFYLTSWQNRSADVLIDRDTAQEIKGIKTFTALPKSTITPTDNAHLVNKAYVDTQIGAVNEILATLTTISEEE